MGTDAFNSFQIGFLPSAVIKRVEIIYDCQLSAPTEQGLGKMRANESGSPGQQHSLSLFTHLGSTSTFVGILLGSSEMVTHRNLELASRVSGVGLAECRRGDYTVVLVKIRMVENVESVPGKINEMGMLPLPHYPPAFRQAKINVCVASGPPGIAPKAKRPVVKNGIVIVIGSRGDVVGKARPSVKDPGNVKTERQGIHDHHIKSMSAVGIGAAPVAVRVVVIGRRIKVAAGVVKGAREHILGHEVDLMDGTFVGDG